MNFYQLVYEMARRIPAGKVATYGQLAALCGSPRASRVVGSAMLRAPEGMPCHRVIYGDGRLCCEQAFGGKEIQRGMLEGEGVTFLEDGRVDLRTCMWDGPTDAENERQPRSPA